MAKITIYSTDVDLCFDLEDEDFQEWMNQNYPEIRRDFHSLIPSAQQVYLDRYNDTLNEMNREWLDMERETLSKCPSKIDAEADLGLWNGRRTGHATFQNLSDILNTSADNAEWYIDTDIPDRVFGVMYHHDGTNYVEYTAVNDDDYTDLGAWVKSQYDI